MSAVTAARSALRLREVVVADDAGLLPIGLQRNRLVAQRQRVAQQPQLRVGREQAEIRARDFRRHDGAHRLARVFAREHVVLRGARRGAVLAPQVELVRRVEPDPEVVARRGEAGRNRRCADSRNAGAAGVDADIERRIEASLRQRHLRARGVDARHRDLQVEVVGERFVDQRRQRRLVEVASTSARDGRSVIGRRRQLDDRRRRRRRRAAGDRRCEGRDEHRVS